MLQENEQVARVARVRQLAEVGDVAGLDRILYQLSFDIDGDWTFDGGQLIGLLREMPVSTRVLLLRSMTDGL
ncbi:hypothetical protein E6W39_38635 [Kitasatospora acidiphila]|uniref:Uncharacterized protein n=1 Tax=Kitasatospora acidiphila TaxID=2567942 RepID=A0A540WDA8_9ACTN|nr:hypothetical protein [Kitasatospora acidiphila]TQF07025.1 hypothetical protein E6W39_38635 [Kitasatospora acidiphila]